MGPRGYSSALSSNHRNRAISACLECRRRRIKCDRSKPCLNCVDSVRKCAYLDPTSLNGGERSRLTQIKEKTASLHHMLESDLARTRPNARQDDDEYVCPWPAIIGDEVVPAGEDEASLQLNTAASPHCSPGADTIDASSTLVINIGRLRFTNRLEGLFRPKLAAEVSSHMLFVAINC